MHTLPAREPERIAGNCVTPKPPVRELPVTGGTMEKILKIGFGLLVLGGAFWLSSRRRRPVHA